MQSISDRFMVATTEEEVAAILDEACRDYEVIQEARMGDIEWIEIPAGEFLFGDKLQKLSLPTFQISKYPITYAQFQKFLDDPEGFADSRWFRGMAVEEDARRMEEQEFKYANHPRERVNWYQALAFCRWLSWRLGGVYDLEKVNEWAVRLPTEYEWEKAARGTDGRIYPYGDEFDRAKGNTYQTGIHRTTPVDAYPNGASPYGVLDMSGNVWEWCLSTYKKPEVQAQKEDLLTDDWRTLRGGSWGRSQLDARAAFRNYGHPAVRYGNVGFRVVCCVRPLSLAGL